jgi:hypothetical protein
MRTSQAQVATGSRGAPLDRGIYPDREKTLADQAKTVRDTSGYTTFQSSFFRYRIQLTNPQTVRDTRTGQEIGDQPKAAQFEEGIFSVRNDAILPDGVPIVTYLKTRKSYGVDFWDVNEMRAKITEAERNQAIEVIRKLGPAERAQIASMLSADGDSLAVQPGT